MDSQFPPEIIQLIVEASLNPYDPFTSTCVVSRQRYSILKKYSLLNSTWRGVSDPLLYEWVALGLVESVEKLCEVASGRGGCIVGVKSLRVSFGSVDSDRLASILRCAPLLVNLDIMGDGLDIDDLVPLQHLRRVSFYDTEIVDSAPLSSPHLPSLRYMTLFESVVFPSASQFLTTSFLPHLRHLELIEMETPTDIARMLPQLEALAFMPAERYTTDGDAYEALCPSQSLLLLDTPFDSEVRHLLLSRIASFPPFLFLNSEWGDAYNFTRELLDLVEEIRETKEEGPRVILLSTQGGTVREELLQLAPRLKEWGIRVEREDSMDFARAIIKMEKILEEEKRAEAERR